MKFTIGTSGTDGEGSRLRETGKRGKFRARARARMVRDVGADR